MIRWKGLKRILMLDPCQKMEVCRSPFSILTPRAGDPLAEKRKPAGSSHSSTVPCRAGEPQPKVKRATSRSQRLQVRSRLPTCTHVKEFPRVSPSYVTCASPARGRSHHKRRPGFTRQSGGLPSWNSPDSLLKMSSCEIKLESGSKY